MLQRDDEPETSQLEGDLLSDILADGPLSREQTVRYAIELGEILARMHTAGSVHGAISPYSVKISNGEASLLAPPAWMDVKAGPYRSPEQVRGQQPDERSDVWAFGALLYQMISGRPPFSGSEEVLDRAILEQAPASPPELDAIAHGLWEIIETCLEKDPARRRQRVRSVVIELKIRARTAPRSQGLHLRRRRDALTTVRSTQRAAGAFVPASVRPDYLVYAKPGLKWRRSAAVVGIVAITAAAVALVTLFLNRAPTAQAVKFTVPAPQNTSYPGTPSVSPDGRYLAFSALGPSGRRMLWLRPFDGETAQPMSDTEGAMEPFWSPDSRHIAFFADGYLKRIGVGGDAVRSICRAGAIAGGGTWNRDDAILFAPGVTGGLYSVPAGGGTPSPVTKLSGEHRAHLWPQFLPDGNSFLFFALADDGAAAGIHVAALNAHDPERLMAAQTNAVFAPAGDRSDDKGFLLFLRDNTLLAQRYNPIKRQLEGTPAELAKGVAGVLSMSLSPVSVSATGLLVYQTLGEPSRQLAWMDRAGKQIAAVEDGGEWGPPRLSPDSARAVAALSSAGERRNADLWLIDRAGNTTRITETPAHEGSPVWSPDGGRVAFFAGQGDSFDLYSMAAAPGAKQELLFSSSLPKYPSDWTHDGRYILFGVINAATRSDVWAYCIPERRAFPLLQTVYAEGYAAVSRDGRWLAYQSDESGANEVYVEPFEPASAGTKPRWKVSDGGGSLPRWRADGGELYYMAQGGALMAASVRNSGSQFQSDKPHVLFMTRPLPKSPWNLFDAAPDGSAFVLNVPLEWSNSTPIQVTTNWYDKLRN